MSRSFDVEREFNDDMLLLSILKCTQRKQAIEDFRKN